jgi:hypothetical protein
MMGCSGDDLDVTTVDLVVENRTGAELWFFQYSDCGADAWTEVIADDEYVANGDDVGAYYLDAGCYDLYIEDENGCSASNSSGSMGGGLVFTWTALADDLTCP